MKSIIIAFHLLNLILRSSIYYILDFSNMLLSIFNSFQFKCLSAINLN